MYYNKRDHPLAVLPELDMLFKELSKTNHRLKFETGEIVRVLDRNESSKFYFKIEGYNTENGKITYKVTSFPVHERVKGSLTDFYQINRLLKEFKDWERMVDLYDDYVPFETVDGSYFEEFFNDFEFNDEDDVKPFHTQLQPLLSRSIDAQIKFLEVSIETNVNINKEEIEEIVEDFKKLNDDIPKVTKRGFIKRWSKIASKIAKTGHKTLTEAKTEMVKEAYKMILRYSVENWHSIQQGATKLIGEGGDFIGTLLS